jgi:hypothetical protein
LPSNSGVGAPGPHAQLFDPYQSSVRRKDETCCDAPPSRKAGHAAHLQDHFPLHALSIDRLPMRKDPSCRDIEGEARKHLMAEAILVGVYER